MKKIIKELEIHENDTGSSEVQIVQLTDKIENLSKHIKNFKKDKINLWIIKKRLSMILKKK